MFGWSNPGNDRKIRESYNENMIGKFAVIDGKGEVDVKII